MINPFREVNWKPSTVEKRTFAKSIAIGLPVVAAVFGSSGWLKSNMWPAWTFWVGGIGAGAGVLLWLLPGLAGPFYVLWHGLGCCVGLVVGNIVVAAIYYLVITPVGLLLRLLGRDPMEWRMEPKLESYWKDAEKVDDAERYFRQY